MIVMWRPSNDEAILVKRIKMSHVRMQWTASTHTGFETLHCLLRQSSWELVWLSLLVLYCMCSSFCWHGNVVAPWWSRACNPHGPHFECITQNWLLWCACTVVNASTVGKVTRKDVHTVCQKRPLRVVLAMERHSWSALRDEDVL